MEKDNHDKRGRPVIFKTAEEMQAVIDKYFDDCKANRLFYVLNKTDSGSVTPPENTITDDEYPTVSGLALCLGMTRRTLIDYGEKEDFSHTVKKAKARVESILEQRLFHPQPTGVIFNLKNNYGWTDKQEIDHRSGDGSMSPSKIELVAPSDDSTDTDTA